MTIRELHRRRRSRGAYLAIFLAIFAVIVAVDYFFGTDLLGAAARFLGRVATYMWQIVAELFRLAGVFASYVWQALLDVGRFMWRWVLEIPALLARFSGVAVEHGWSLLGAIASSKVWKYVLPVALGEAAARYFLRTKRAKKRTRWTMLKEAFWAAMDDVSIWWRARHFVTKCVIVAVMIAAQWYLHLKLILFPIAFLIPYIAMALRSTRNSILRPIVETWYLSRFGKWHEQTMRRVRAWPVVRHLIGLRRLWRLYFQTGWRIWYYDPRFAFPEWKPVRRETIGRIRFAIATIPYGEWAKRRRYNRPLLGCRERHQMLSSEMVYIEKPEAAE